MRIGIVTDIHEAVQNLRAALAVFAAQRVDAIVQIGDALDLPTQAAGEVIELLASAGVQGVWGNHDFGFCHDVPEFLREKLLSHHLTYMLGMQPRLEFSGCLFAHVDPYLDPFDPAAFYGAPGAPHSVERATPSFHAVPHRVIFIGHYHRWSVTSDVGPVAWAATSPLLLDPARRYIVVVGPLVNGEFGIYDTETALLTPLSVRTPP